MAGNDLDRALEIVSKAHSEEKNPKVRLSLRAALRYLKLAQSQAYKPGITFINEPNRTPAVGYSTLR